MKNCPREGGENTFLPKVFSLLVYNIQMCSIEIIALIKKNVNSTIKKHKKTHQIFFQMMWFLIF